MSAIVQAAIREALTEMLPTKMNTMIGRLMMLTYQKQEDPEERRYQVVKRVAATLPENIVGPKTAKGPARGLWQFEAGGGIKGVLNHRKTSEYIRGICEHYNVPAEPIACWHAIEHNDVLAACFARLLLWSDPFEMPKYQDAEGAFALYLRTWRPGAYTRGNATQKKKLQEKFYKNHMDARIELNIL